MAANDFYEDDEPIEKILAAFERGDKRITRRPAGAPVAFSLNVHFAAPGQPVTTGTTASKVTVSSN